MRDLYKAEFIQDIKIEDLIPEGYAVSFYLNGSECPVTIIAELSDEEFLPFIKEEIRKRKFHKAKYYETHKLYLDCK
jgi:hypothetical protein